MPQHPGKGATAPSAPQWTMAVVKVVVLVVVVVVEVVVACRLLPTVVEIGVPVVT